MDGADELIRRIRAMASDLPTVTAVAVARGLSSSPEGDWSSLRGRLAVVVPNPHYRRLVADLVAEWQRVAPEVTPAAMGLAILTACPGIAPDPEVPLLSLAWTGPGGEPFPIRRTDQALLEVIGEAHEELTIVSFVAYKVPRVRDALVAAAERGARIRLILESQEESEGRLAYAGLAALGPDLANRATVYVWPRARRPTDAAGNRGSLHAKCAIADGRTLFLSSANLTEYAFSLNMELGILVHGGHAPRRAQEHFETLIRSGTLVPLVTETE
jgi:phosphatidylserine/phosphatidylglycerophosphate/cardiolipin synthase-like enzyme